MLFPKKKLIIKMNKYFVFPKKNYSLKEWGKCIILDKDSHILTISFPMCKLTSY